MKLEAARRIAEQLIESMQPYCERVMIAGSIRRGRAEVKDIEICAQARWSMKIPAALAVPPSLKKAAKNYDTDVPLTLPCNWELFGTADTDEPEIPIANGKLQNLLYHWAYRQNIVTRWIKTGVPTIISWDIKPDGKYWRGIIEPEDGLRIKLDLFLLKQDNWGVLSVIRTGPAEFSQALVTVIKNKTPFRVKDGFLIKEETGEILPCPEEEDFFRKAEIRFVPVETRSSANPYAILQLEN